LDLFHFKFDPDVFGAHPPGIEGSSEMRAMSLRTKLMTNKKNAGIDQQTVEFD
jgi:hypothetical protein